MSEYDYHLERALKSVQSNLVAVTGQNVNFPIQDGPVEHEGRNGCDATDLIRFTIGLYRSFNSAIPCRENSITITKLEEALMWQENRTRIRTVAGVEGTNDAAPADEPDKVAAAPGS